MYKYNTIQVPTRTLSLYLSLRLCSCPLLTVPMHPSRLLLSFLTIVGSLDTGIGFSFCHAHPSPLPSLSTTPPLRQPFLATRTCTTSIMTEKSALRQRKTNDASSKEASSSSALQVSGGATAAEKQPSYKKLPILFTSLWGSGGVIYILAKAIKRVMPIALEPFQKGAVPLSQVQLG